MKFSTNKKKGNRGARGDLGDHGDPEVNPKREKMVEGIPESFVRGAKLCLAFQKGQCEEPGDHVTEKGTSITHNCATCMKLSKATVPDHCSKTCPKKKQLFPARAGR